MLADKRFGIFLGRFQPIHLGHQQVINQIYTDGLEPIIGIGSIDVTGTDRNPLNYHERKKLIHTVYPKIETVPLQDFNDWDKWFSELEKSFGQFILDRSIFYVNDKKEDLTSFEFDGKMFENVNYTECFRHIGYPVKQIELPYQIPVRATDIRENLVNNRHYLDGRVFQKLLKDDRFG
jgi:cytidyltransferase-like protein